MSAGNIPEWCFDAWELRAKVTGEMDVELNFGWRDFLNSQDLMYSAQAEEGRGRLFPIIINIIQLFNPTLNLNKNLKQFREVYWYMVRVVASATKDLH